MTFSHSGQVLLLHPHVRLRVQPRRAERPRHPVRRARRAAADDGDAAVEDVPALLQRAEGLPVNVSQSTFTH